VKLALLLVVSAFLSVALGLQAVAEDNQTVNATVSLKMIALTVSEDELEYGVLAVGESEKAPVPDKVTIKNTGNVNEDFMIKGASSLPDGWTLTSNTPGTDTYRHKFSAQSTGTFTPLTISNALLTDHVAPQGEGDVFFRLDMPQVSTSSDEQTLPVIITAFESLGFGPT
jgi:hypothetical protein